MQIELVVGIAVAGIIAPYLLGRIYLACSPMIRAANKGVELTKRKSFGQAIIEFDRAIKMDPRSTHLYALRALTFCELGEYQKAVDDLNTAIDLKPDAYTYYERGNTHLKMNKHDEAIADFTETINLEPKFAVAYYGRAQAYEKLDKHELATRDREAAIKHGFKLESKD